MFLSFFKSPAAYSHSSTFRSCQVREKDRDREIERAHKEPLSATFSWLVSCEAPITLFSFPFLSFGFPTKAVVFNVLILKKKNRKSQLRLVSTYLWMKYKLAIARSERERERSETESMATTKEGRRFLGASTARWTKPPVESRGGRRRVEPLLSATARNEQETSLEVRERERVSQREHVTHESKAFLLTFFFFFLSFLGANGSICFRG